MAARSPRALGASSQPRQITTDPHRRRLAFAIASAVMLIGSTTRPLRFSVETWPRSVNFDAALFDFRQTRASGSVVDACVSFLRASAEVVPDTVRRPTFRWQLIWLERLDESPVHGRARSDKKVRHAPRRDAGSSRRRLGQQPVAVSAKPAGTHTASSSEAEEPARQAVCLLLHQQPRATNRVGGPCSNWAGNDRSGGIDGRPASESRRSHPTTCRAESRSPTSESPGASGPTDKLLERNIPEHRSTRTAVCRISSQSVL